MTDINLAEIPHRRKNLLTGEWVLVSPHRNKRPWQGQLESTKADVLPHYDETCYLCPGNFRTGGHKNPSYQDTFAFDNDFAALVPREVGATDLSEGLLQAHPETGICRVICFSPRHDLSMAEMRQDQLEKVVDLWQKEYRTLGAYEDINYVQIFENKGSVMGCSNPHPHGQIWSQCSVPDEPKRELERMTAYLEENGQPLLIDYLNLELEQKDRIVCENDGFVALVPFWATWPFEILVLPRRQMESLDAMTDAEKVLHAEILKCVTVRYDNLFQVSFPYSSGIHQSPTDGKPHPECTFHMHFFPPLLRSASVKKFMVGYEMLGGSQRDITPETSAQLLRDLGDLHYKVDPNSEYSKSL